MSLSKSEPSLSFPQIHFLILLTNKPEMITNSQTYFCANSFLEFWQLLSVFYIQMHIRIYFNIDFVKILTKLYPYNIDK